jgi:hypothetical protein
MDARPPTPNELPEPRISSRFRGLLRASEPEPAFPAAGEARFEEAIRGHFAEHRRRRRLRLVLRWSGAAAAVLLLAFVLPPLLREPALPPAAPLHGDVDRDGRVDVLDAFALARALEAARAEAIDKAIGDANADGRLDRQDVDAIVRDAVDLGRRAPR